MPTPSQSDRTPTAPPYATEHLANVAAAVRALEHPKQIGPYVIDELIGEGGMGTVYRAEQQSPIRRTVALKVIKLGMDTRQVIARFESERQALALMNHPNVAQVFDAGATESGRPYFVMEFVAGESITAFADRHQLTVRQRLELFMQACDAVQHAHQKAIIHRDLKPSNILVTIENDKPWVKVIDFGVAKATDQRLTQRTVFTESGQLLGTPEYMAPEQAEGDAHLDVDTRSDVYSLGVVLYELLSGALPFDARSLRSAGYAEIQRIIREVDPPRPSTRLSGLGESAKEIARLRQITLDSLSRQLKSELEWIPLKAMRKDRADRYATPVELSQDIENYLQSRPLRAAPESRAYRARKFLKRNKRSVVVSGAMLLLLIGGIVATTWQAVRATRAEHVARRESAEADRQRQAAVVASENVNEVNRFLTDLLASASPEVTRGREMTVREAIDRAAGLIPKRFKNRPISEGAVQEVLAETYVALGEPARGLPHVQAAREIYLREYGPDHRSSILATANVGRDLANMHRHAEAEVLLRDSLERSRRLLGEDDEVTINCLSGLAMTLRMQERFAEAEPVYRQVLAADRRQHGDKSEMVAQSLNNLAVLLNTQGRADEAEPLYREALALREADLGKDHPNYLHTMANLARVLETQGKLPEAEALLREALAMKRRVLKDDHPSTLLSMNDLATIIGVSGDLEGAERLHREAFDRRRRALGEDDVETLQSMNNLGIALGRLGRYAEAEEMLRKTVEKRRIVLGTDHRHTLASIVGLVRVLASLNKWEEAEKLLIELSAPANFAKLNPPQQATVLARYGTILAKNRQFDKAEPMLLDARQRLMDLKTPTGEAIPLTLEALANVAAQTNRPQEAAKWRAELEQARAARPATAPTTAPALR